jgi:peptidoglycan/xylan/chitin deacetylase (PgdA/CDA1 family)
MRHIPTPIPSASPLPPPPLPRFAEPTLAKFARPFGTIGALPGGGNLVALTVDDGLSAETISGYATFIKESGMRVTFFVTGSYRGWEQNVEALMPLVESGHVQLANHTWTHPSLVKSSDQQIVDELLRCEDFLATTFGVSGKPYFRPPYGYIDDRVRAVAAGIGYTVPVLWYGSLADSSPITPAQLEAFAAQWLTAHNIVIGHANYITVTQCFYAIHKIILDRGLQPVTLDDVFVRT